MNSRTVEEILNDSEELFSRKEEDYGESWKLTGRILSLIIEQQGKEEITIPSEPEYLISLGLYTRRLDKLVRSFNATFIQGELEVDESVPETVEDQVPYAAMQTSVAEDLAEETMSNSTASTGDIEPGVEPREYEHCKDCGVSIPCWVFSPPRRSTLSCS